MKTAWKIVSVVFICILFFYFLPVNAFLVRAYRTIQAEVPVSCIRISGNDNNSYDIFMEADDSAAPMPRNDHLHMSLNENESFVIDITEPGTYKYKVYQLQGDKEDIQYDSRVYSVTVFVSTDKSDDLLYQDIISSGNGYVLDGLHLENGADSCEFLLVERGNSTILSAHPDWNWSGSYEWDSGKSGYFSKTTKTVYDQNQQNPESVFGVEFEITRDDISENVQKSLTLKNKYTAETVDLTATKKWISPTGSTLDWPTGKSVQFELGTVVNVSFESMDPAVTVTLDNNKDQNGEEQPGTAVFRRLPKYEEGSADQTVTYAVREVGDVGGYDVVYPSSGLNYAVFGFDNTATIKNREESVSVSVTKNWIISAGNLIPDGAKAVLRLYSYTGNDATKAAWVQNVNDIELDGTADTNGESSSWVATFSALPKYDSSGAVLNYIVKEQSCIPLGYSSVEEYASNVGSITNQPSVTSFSVTKEWQDTERNEWPGNTQITFNLRRKTYSGTVDDSFLAEYNLTNSSVSTDTVLYDWQGDPVDVSWNGSTLTIAGLEKYTTSGDEWLYYISESDLDGFDVIYKNPNGYVIENETYSGGKIVNIKAAVNAFDLIVQKTVTGNFGNLTKEFDFSVTLVKTSDNSPYTGTITAVKTDADGTDTTSSLTLSDEGIASFRLSHNETIRLKDIPTDLSYTVEETGTTDGYSTTVTVNSGEPSAGRSTVGEMSSETTVLFTNTRNGIVPTDADVSFAAVLILFVGIFGIVFRYFFRRRRILKDRIDL